MLKLLLGRAGTGKTHALLETIAAQCGRPVSAAMRSSRARVFPAPARPSSSFSMALPPSDGDLMKNIIAYPSPPTQRSGGRFHCRALPNLLS